MKNISILLAALSVLLFGLNANANSSCNDLADNSVTVNFKNGEITLSPSFNVSPEEHSVCLKERDDLIWKAGYGVKKLKLTFYSDKDKAYVSCPSEDTSDCIDEFRSKWKIKASKLEADEFFYDIAIEPVDPNGCRNAVCVLDPRIVIK